MFLLLTVFLTFVSFVVDHKGTVYVLHLQITHFLASLFFSFRFSIIFISLFIFLFNMILFPNELIALVYFYFSISCSIFHSVEIIKQNFQLCYQVEIIIMNWKMFHKCFALISQNLSSCFLFILLRILYKFDKN